MTDAIRTVIADDEPLARELLAAMLEPHPDVRVVAECADGASVVRALRETSPDLLLLDVEMPEMDGFQVLQAGARGRLPVVVMVTAFANHAVRAFEHGVADYLLKPFDEERLDRTLARVRERFADSRDSERMLALLEDLHRRTARPERLPVIDGERCTFVSVSDVVWLEADGKHTKLHVGGGSVLCRQGITSLERQLDPSVFVRVNRSAIVRVNAVAELHRWFRGEYLLILADGTRLATGKKFRGGVAGALGIT